MQLWEDLQKLSEEIDEEVSSAIEPASSEEERALRKAARPIKGHAASREEREIATEAFVRGSFEAVLQLHEEIVAAKEETLRTLREENALLKEALYQLQELYHEEHATLKTLEKQLGRTEEELEITRRKYRLMWEKAIENYENEGGEK